MKKFLKHVIGIDVAQDELVVCLGQLGEDLVPAIYGNKAVLVVLLSKPPEFITRIWPII